MTHLQGVHPRSASIPKDRLLSLGATVPVRNMLAHLGPPHGVLVLVVPLVLCCTHLSLSGHLLLAPCLCWGVPSPLLVSLRL